MTFEQKKTTAETKSAVAVGLHAVVTRPAQPAVSFSVCPPSFRFGGQLPTWPLSLLFLRGVRGLGLLCSFAFVADHAVVGMFQKRKELLAGILNGEPRSALSTLTGSAFGATTFRVTHVAIPVSVFGIGLPIRKQCPRCIRAFRCFFHSVIRANRALGIKQSARNNLSLFKGAVQRVQKFHFGRDVGPIREAEAAAEGFLFFLRCVRFHANNLPNRLGYSTEIANYFWGVETQ